MKENEARICATIPPVDSSLTQFQTKRAKVSLRGRFYDKIELFYEWWLCLREDGEVHRKDTMPQFCQATVLAIRLQGKPQAPCGKGKSIYTLA